MNAKDILTHYQNFAVIGVTTNPDKFGYKIYQRMGFHLFIKKLMESQLFPI